MFSISPSKLRLFLRCPRAYKFEYVDFLRDQYHKKTPPLEIGNIIHKVLQDFYKLPKKLHTYKALRRLFKEKLLAFLGEKEEHKAIFSGQADINEWVEKAKAQFKNFARSELSKTEPYIVPEKWIETKKENLKLIGVLDRIDKEEDGLHIIDYKTGKPKEARDELDNFQLLFYALMLKNKYPSEDVSKASYYYLGDNRLVNVEIKPGSLKETFQKIKATVTDIQKEVEFAPRKNTLCKYCDYLEICPIRNEVVQK